MYRQLIPSFAGGEVSPEVAARADAAKYSVWLDKCRNMTVRPQGGVSRRTGFKHVLSFAEESSVISPAEQIRLIPFLFSSDQASILALSSRGYIYVITDDSLVTTLTASWITDDNIWSIRWTQNKDTVIMCDGSVVKELLRKSATAWLLDDYDYTEGPFLDEDDDITGHFYYDGTDNYFILDSGSLDSNDIGYSAKAKCFFSAQGYKATLSSTANAEAVINHMFFSYSAFTLRLKCDSTAGGATGKVIMQISEDQETWLDYKVFEVENDNTDINLTGDLADEDNPYFVRFDCSNLSFGTGAVSYLSVNFNSFYYNVIFTLSEYVSGIKAKIGKIVSPAEGCLDYIAERALSEGASELFPTALTSNTSDSSRTVSVYIKKYGNYGSVNSDDGYKIMDKDSASSIDFTLMDGTYGYVKILFDSVFCSKIKISFNVEIAPGYSSSGFWIVSLRIWTSTTTYKIIKSWDFVSDGEQASISDVEVPVNCDIVGFDVYITGGVYGNGIFHIREIELYTRTTAVKSFDYCGPAWTDANGFPKKVTQYQERVVFANSDRDPDTLWCTETGELKSFHQDIDPVDSDAVISPCSGKQSVYINEIVAGRALFALSRLGEYVFTGTALTPSENGFTQHTAYGCADVEPALAGGFLFFVERISNAIRTFSYDYNSDSYNGQDLTYLSRHFFENKTIRQIVWQQKPYNTLWALMTDGTLVYATIVMEQELVSWQKVELGNADTDIVSIGTIPGDEQDELYAVMRYKTSAGIYHNHLVKIAPVEAELSDMCYLDLAYHYTTDTATTSVTMPAADYEALKDDLYVMSAGRIITGWSISGTVLTLPEALTDVLIGIKYDAYIRLLPLAAEGNNGTMLNSRSRIPAVEILLKDSVGGTAAVYGAGTAYNLLKFSSFDSAPELQSGWSDRIVLPGSSVRDPQLEIRQSLPYPLNVLSIIPTRC